MRGLWADLHVHIGQANGRMIKVAASSAMSLFSVLKTAENDKGLDVLGVVDCGCPSVLAEIGSLIEQGHLLLKDRGDIETPNGLFLVLGAEVESREGAHFITYFPHLKAVKSWQEVMAKEVKNLELSTPHTSLGARELLELALEVGGFFIVAHAFTPHKGAYGCWIERLREGFGELADEIGGIELGLSADSYMAGLISETDRYPYVASSDAHSLINIGREYMRVRVAAAGFEELVMAFRGDKGRGIEGLYGLNPALGKYHRSFCPSCQKVADIPHPVFSCPNCSQKMVTGVWDRVMSIRDRDVLPGARYPYYYRVPLHFLPGIGPKTRQKLKERLGGEIKILEEASVEQIAEVAGKKVAGLIEDMRLNKFCITAGGGGRYGRISQNRGGQ